MKLIPVKTSHPAYPFVENLLHSAFPPEERRDDDLQRQLADSDTGFTVFLIEEDGPAGLLTAWTFDAGQDAKGMDGKPFTYLEHLAIDPEKRNGGMGGRVLETLKTQIRTPLVLEVEEPADEFSRRRIGFYQRHGFILCPIAYRQPPYRKGDGFLPMKLMHYGWENFEAGFEAICKQIYQKAYGYYA